jgi:preprotein translocase SecE subunit
MGKMMGRVKQVGSSISRFTSKVTRPIRRSRIWRFLRRTILRSPFGGYFKNSWQELRLVKWPDRKTALKLTLVVIIFSAVFSAFTTALDYGFEKLAKQLFLK